MTLWAVAGRVLRGIITDRPTLAFVVGAPILVLFLFGAVLDSVPEGRFDVSYLPAVLVGLFAFLLTYVLTGIGFLRERREGTLERITSLPVRSFSVVAGYFVGFGVLALLQATILLGAGWVFLDLRFEHSILLFYAIESLGALTALGLGILVSVVARTEFQVLQGIPVLLAPQIILGGVFVPVDALPGWLEPVARALPLTYLLDGVVYITLDQGTAAELWLDLGVLGGFTALSIAVAAAVLRR